MVITSELLDTLSEQAKVNPRLRQAFGLRNMYEDGSQRMHNALEPGSFLPIHCHKTTSEVINILRVKVRRKIFNENGELIESVITCEDSFPNFYVIPAGQWHNTDCLHLER